MLADGTIWALLCADSIVILSVSQVTEQGFEVLASFI